MYKTLRRILLSFAFTGFAATSMATPIVGGNTLLDTNTGLEWLGLTSTAGQSFGDVTRELKGGMYDGFRYATRNEIKTLFGNLKIPDIDVIGGTAGNYNSVDELMNLWYADICGFWGLCPQDEQIGYFYTENRGNGLLWLAANGLAEASSGPDRMSMGRNSGPDVKFFGSALVRRTSLARTASILPTAQVPLPSTLLLFSLGLAGLGFARRMKA